MIKDFLLTYTAVEIIQMIGFNLKYGIILFL